MTNLYIMDGAMAGLSFELKSDTTLIGRAANNDLQIQDATVSRKHLKIIKREGKFFVEDFGSQNGTWVNGQLIRPREAVEVEEGVSIIIGEILASLGRKPSEDYLSTQYSINLSGLIGEEGEDLLYKSTLTTNRRRLEKIHEVSIAFMQSLDIDEICEKIMDSLFYCLKEIDSGIVLLIDSKTGELEEKISRSRDSKKDIKMNYSLTIVDRVIHEGKALMMADTKHENQEELSDSIKMMRLRSIMCAPLISKSGIRGAIYVHSTSVHPGFPKDDLFLLAGLSAPAAVAVENSLLYSARKHTEEALKKAHDEMEKRVEERTADLSRANILLKQEIGGRKQAEEEKEKLQAQLAQAHKMEAIGTLAGGIAHDFNNMLAAVLGNISLARMETGPGSNVFRLLTEAEKASTRAKELTARLITFSRGGEPVKEVTSIGDLVEDTVSAMLTDSGIDCEISIPDDLSPVEIDKVQMKQVIYGITTNALEAMTGKGTIKVYCENVAVEKKDALTLRKGKYVRISIEDQGIGIPKEDLQKIFDPYFSTKEMGSNKGQGLGLSISHSIVKKHDGLITVESELGAGTTVHIYLHASEKEIAKFEPVKKAVSARPVTGRGKILVMDDEEMVRNVSAALLNKLGYDVELAVDGVEAIGMYKEARESGEPFDVVILDLTNQFGMGGREAIEKLLEIDPDVKAIIVSGYSNDPIMSNFGAYGFKGVLTKPFTMDEMSRALHRLITGEGE